MVKVLASPFCQLVNSEYLHPGETSRQKSVKLLIASYYGYKHSSNSGKCSVKTVITEENLSGHFLGKLEGQEESLSHVRKRWQKKERRLHLRNILCIQTVWRSFMSPNVG